MAEDAVVGLPETRLGLVPDVGGSSRLPQIVGVGRAKELIMTCARDRRRRRRALRAGEPRRRRCRSRRRAGRRAAGVRADRRRAGEAADRRLRPARRCRRRWSSRSRAQERASRVGGRRARACGRGGRAAAHRTFRAAERPVGSVPPAECAPAQPLPGLALAHLEQLRLDQVGLPGLHHHRLLLPLTASVTRPLPTWVSVPSQRSTVLNVAERAVLVLAPPSVR